MSGAASVVLATARALIGTAFRLHGRDPAHGLDCVGLVCVAFAAAGVRIVAPSGYRLASGRLDQFEAAASGAGLCVVAEAKAGDAVLCRVDARQWHLGIASGDGLIHADAGLGRVVERPGAMPWPVARCWRMELGGEVDGDAGADGGGRRDRGTGRRDAGRGDRATGGCRDLCAQGPRGTTADRSVGADVELR